MSKKHALTPTKARQILSDGSVRGHPLTAKQRRYFGLIAGGGHPSKKIKKWDRKVDNKMKGYGETDYDKMKVRINKSKKKNKEKGEILDSIIHERQHIKHPKKHEKNVKKDTTKEISQMSKKEQAKAYALFKKKRRA